MSKMCIYDNCTFIGVPATLMNHCVSEFPQKLHQNQTEGLAVERSGGEIFLFAYWHHH
jgi:hypothetical protein